MFRIQVQPNIDSDSDGINETFSWTPYIPYTDSFGEHPYLLVKGRGTVIIDVPDGVTYQTAYQETIMHINWYTMLGGNYTTGYNNQDILGSLGLVRSDSIITEGRVHTADSCTRLTNMTKTATGTGSAVLISER